MERGCARYDQSFGVLQGLWDTKITVGANNVLDRDPPFNGYDLEGYDTGTYSGLGRFVYVRLEKDF